ncbi:MAG: hypothetical protein GKR95_23220 [Gammaproteobacteria bacterium]|nr:hypothetical protein [Gammaproteobacteria bacterium]
MLGNFLIVPLNYYMYLDNSVLQEPKWWLLPPAWSLGLELQAYLILPFAVYYKRLKIFIGLLSFLVFFTANIGFMDTDRYGYRLIPGTLFIFILGLSTYRNTSKGGVEADVFDKYFPPLAYITLVLMLTVLGIYNSLHVNYTVETCLGILIGLPIITYLSRRPINLPMNRLLGDLSYGLFLSHFLAMWIIDEFDLVEKSTSGRSYGYIIATFTISLGLSVVSVFFVERFITKYRYRITSIRQ